VKSNTTKLIVAIVLLIVAGVLIAWNFGVFESKQPAPTTTGTAPVKTPTRGMAPGAQK
jgi:hypothetical protein